MSGSVTIVSILLRRSNSSIILLNEVSDSVSELTSTKFYLALLLDYRFFYVFCIIISIQFILNSHKKIFNIENYGK